VSNLKGVQEYQPVDGDIFVVTYPKCGTTWIQEVCYLIFNDGEAPKSHLERLVNTPFLELFGVECIAGMKKPGAIKSHLPFNRIPYSDKAKYVCVIRNPKDCVVSFFYHTSQTYPGYMFTEGTFEQFFELFINGKTDFGDYFEHVASWLKQRGKENIYFIYFEDVKRKPKEEILKLGKFLDDAVYEKLSNGLIDKVIEASSIKNMKEAYKNFEFDVTDPSITGGIRNFIEANILEQGQTTVSFEGHVRKGNVNDWRVHLTPEMNARMEKRIRDELEPQFPDLIEKWRLCGVFDSL